MAITQTMHETAFTDDLLRDKYASWSYKAAYALYNYYDELSDETGKDFEFDRVAIRCDWNEYDDLDDAWSELGNGTNFIEGEELAIDDNIQLWLENNTTVINLDNGRVLVQAF